MRSKARMAGESASQTRSPCSAAPVSMFVRSIGVTVTVSAAARCSASRSGRSPVQRVSTRARLPVADVTAVRRAACQWV